MARGNAPLPVRRSIRLRSFDYTNPGAYFVTLCAHNQRNPFGKIVQDEMVLNLVGHIVNECWLDLARHFPNIRLARHVVMPNHLHGIISIQERARHAVPLRVSSGAGSNAPPKTHAFASAVRGSLPTIVGAFKAAASKRVRAAMDKPSFRLWQRGYFEHVIRNEDDFEKTCKYIRLNPRRWTFDADNLLP